MLYPDSHFHLDLTLERGISLPPSLDLEGIEVGTTCDDLEKRLEALKPYPKVKYSLGIGPWSTELEESIDVQIETLQKNLRQSKPVAIGEIGLDYHYAYSTPERQKELFIKQIEIANELSLPIIIHSREADDDMITVLKAHKVKNGGILHCFSSGKELLEFGIENNFLISFSGNVTFKKNLELQELARLTPLNFILAETDSPYMAPVPMRGRTNSPEYVKYVYAFLAALKGLEEEELRVQIVNNLNSFYKRAYSS